MSATIKKLQVGSSSYVPNFASLPTEDTYYSQAKFAEQVEKDFEKAEKLYYQAISSGQRVDSAIMDLATVYHQQGKTYKAWKFLEEHRHLCRKSKQSRINNLIDNLQKQLVPTGNYLNKILVAFSVDEKMTAFNIQGMFETFNRIDKIEFVEGQKAVELLDGYEPIKDRWFPKPELKVQRAVMLHFTSNSGARKTLDSLLDSNVQFYWMNTNGKIVRKAEPYKKKENHSDGSSEKENVFDSEIDVKNIWNSCLYTALDVEVAEDESPVYFNEDMSRVGKEISNKTMETKLKIDSNPNFIKDLVQKYSEDHVQHYNVINFLNAIMD